VKWDPTECRLVDSVDRKFSVLYFRQLDIDLIRSTNRPFVIRILVRIPDAGLEPRARFDDITTFEMDDCLLTTRGNNFSFENFGPRKMRYNIVAVVRLRSEENEQGEMDHVRLYSVLGEHIVPFGSGHNCWSQAWSFGEPGRSYMLYYVPYADAPTGCRERLDLEVPLARYTEIEESFSAAIHKDEFSFDPMVNPVTDRLGKDKAQVMEAGLATAPAQHGARENQPRFVKLSRHKIPEALRGSSAKSHRQPLRAVAELER
jgi:hypothetical protein